MVKCALDIDHENGNSLWQDTIVREMEAVRVAFKVMNEGEELPCRYQYMECHLMFDIKLDGFQRKACLVAGGHMTETLVVLTYASVASRDSVCIALTIAALNDHQVKASDVQNAFLMSPGKGQIWTMLGPEFGADAGKKAFLVHALYGLKSAGGSFGCHLADWMMTLGYSTCKLILIYCINPSLIWMMGLDTMLTFYFTLMID